MANRGFKLPRHVGVGLRVMGCSNDVVSADDSGKILVNFCACHDAEERIATHVDATAARAQVGSVNPSDSMQQQSRMHGHG